MTVAKSVSETLHARGQPAPKENRPAAQFGLVDEHVFLIGRPPITEFFAFIRSLAIDGENIPQGALAAAWRVANAHVRELEKTEPDEANNPPIEAVPAALASLEEEVQNDQIFQRSYQLAPTRIGIVELDRLVVHQKFINVQYAKSLQQVLGAEPTPDEVFRFCLPVNHPHPPVKTRPLGNGYQFISASNDLRFIEAISIDASRISDYTPAGPVAAVIGLVVGFTCNFFSALEVEGRLLLHNGSHRAYALRALGITHAPCVIQSVGSRDELEMFNADVHKTPDRYLTDPRPPMLKDYFDPVLTMNVPVVRKHHLVQVAFSPTAGAIPAA